MIENWDFIGIQKTGQNTTIFMSFKKVVSIEYLQPQQQFQNKGDTATGHQSRECT